MLGWLSVTEPFRFANCSSAALENGESVRMSLLEFQFAR
jgi:hypothetical protein